MRTSHDILTSLGPSVTKRNQIKRSSQSNYFLRRSSDLRILRKSRFNVKMTIIRERNKIIRIKTGRGRYERNKIIRIKTGRGR